MNLPPRKFLVLGCFGAVHKYGYPFSTGGGGGGGARNGDFRNPGSLSVSAACNLHLKGSRQGLLFGPQAVREEKEGSRDVRPIIKNIKIINVCTIGIFWYFRLWQEEHLFI